MKIKKVFYIIEPIDVDNDKIPDGFIASQYRIDKYGNKIFLKTKYITFKDFKSKIGKKGGMINNNKLQNNNDNVVVMTRDEYNKFMNQNPYNQNPYNQNPPSVAINNGANNNGNTFMSNVGYGVGAGVGFAAGDALFDGVASFF